MFLEIEGLTEGLRKIFEKSGIPWFWEKFFHETKKDKRKIPENREALKEIFQRRRSWFLIEPFKTLDFSLFDTMKLIREQLRYDLWITNLYVLKEKKSQFVWSLIMISSIVFIEDDSDWKKALKGREFDILRAPKFKLFQNTPEIKMKRDTLSDFI